MVSFYGNCPMEKQLDHLKQRIKHVLPGAHDESPDEEPDKSHDESPDESHDDM